MKPRIAITVGDPAGIGPEIAARAAADTRVLAACDPILYEPPPATAFTPGELSAEAGRAAYDCVVRAVADARDRVVDGIATAPVNKLAFARAGLPWKGHTDLLAHLCDVPRVAMLFHAPELNVVLATVHVPLSDVARVLTHEVMRETVLLTARAMPLFGITEPRIAVAGLNPHAGEDGLLGSEEDLIIRPAIADALRAGVDVSGPYPADTIFTRALRRRSTAPERGSPGEFDVVVACYHDQGLIPVKLLAFGRAVNVTIGLPIVRTSVDHGTAFDIAGKGMADPGSMIEAVLLAARLSAARREQEPGPAARGADG
jgi:4-hydroxythreonine-4-phosphate dehydrogenase